VEVHPNSGQLIGPNRTEHLDPKVMDVLLRLAEGGGRVVTRRTLMKDVWGEVVVTDFALSRCVYQLRKALRSVAGTDEQPIETLPKRGYRLTWPIMHAHPTEEPVQRQQRPLWLALGFLSAFLVLAVSAWLGIGRPAKVDGLHSAAADGSVRLAVLPMESLSSDPAMQSFARGLAMEIVHEVARVPGVAVLGRTSAFDGSQQGMPRLELGRRLGAEYILSGSLQGVGSQRRVLLNLLAVPDGRLMWSQTYLLATDAPFVPIRNVAKEIANLFDFLVDPGAGIGSTDNLEAFEAYLEAYQAEGPDAKRARLRYAVELDPEFAQAWNALAALEVMPVWNGEVPVEEAWSRAQPFLERALEIAPDLPDAFLTLGRFRREFGDLDGAIEMFRKTLEVDPGHDSAAANLGLVLRFAGDFEQALEIHAAAVEADPLDALAITRLGTSYWFAERHEEAALLYRRAAEILPDNEEIYDSWAGMLAMGMGRFDEALLRIEQKAAVEGRPTVRTLATKAFLADTLGLDRLAAQTWDAALERATDKEPIELRLAYRLLARGEDTAARALLYRATVEDSDDADTQWMLGLLDIESGHPDRFLQRVQATFPDFEEELGDLRPLDVPAVLVTALALLENGQQEAASSLLRAAIDVLGRPLAREHLWAAAAHAMLGDTRSALAELRRSPPGWVRVWAPLALRDPRFASLRGTPEFRALVEGHLEALERQYESTRAQMLDVRIAGGH
jgi:tetratricopeptide (TPR) repeat protein/DNA-binding winged helix-turn-helix (wHTH) protein